MHRLHPSVNFQRKYANNYNPMFFITDIPKTHHLNTLAEGCVTEACLQCSELTVLSSCYVPDVDCQVGAEALYRGTVTTGRYGGQCQAWGSDYPRIHSRHPEDFPEAGLEGSYCRNPDQEGGVWCFPMNKEAKYELCDVPVCPTLYKYYCQPRLSYTNTVFDGDGTKAIYRGTIDVTRSGKHCLNWFTSLDATMHLVHWKSTKRVQSIAAGLGDHNHCRDPWTIGSVGCYVPVKTSVWFEGCEVPYCTEGPMMITLGPEGKKDVWGFEEDGTLHGHLGADGSAMITKSYSEPWQQ